MCDKLELRTDRLYWTRARWLCTLEDGRDGLVVKDFKDGTPRPEISPGEVVEFDPREDMEEVVMDLRPRVKAYLSKPYRLAAVTQGDALLRDSEEIC